MNTIDAYDIIMMSDLRLPGGTTASMAEEIRAQAATGYRTALVHVNSKLVGKDLGVSAHLRRCIDEGLAELVLPGRRVRAPLAVLRHPTVFEPATSPDVDVVVDAVAMIANNTAADAGGVSHYDPVQVNDAVTAVLGVKPTWYPIGPAVRESLRPSAASLHLADTDWLNVIDLDEWTVDRARGVRARPVIGRHSRPQPAKWPEHAADLRAAYPDTDEFDVRILGGADPVRRTLGSIPGRWIVEPFGARDPRDFVADLDFFVYFHRSDLVEAYGRTIMEALAGGAVAILPAHFRESFGDAAIYAEPAQVRGIVRRLAADPAAYAEQSRRGVEFVARTHGYEVHAARLEQLIGSAAGPELPVRSRRRVRDRARVLFVSSNGAGMGHLTRLLAMASRSSEQVEPMFFSLSQAVPVVATYGYPWEYCPSRGDLGIATNEWNGMFAGRFREVVRTFRPDALVFDGTWPYRGLIEARADFPQLLYVWSRRGMWRAETESSQLRHAATFDLVVEPGEFAAAYDRGPTAGRDDATRVGPITLVEPDQLLDREAARAELGIEGDAPALLVTLGAGNINDTTSALDVVADAAIAQGWDVYATKAPIARGRGPARTDVRTLSVYPLARYLRAFDGAVAAAGYNSYHEMIMAAVPTVFVPNLETMTDDQLARARFAEEAGVGICLSDVTPPAAADAIGRLSEEAVRAAMHARAADYPANGAGPAMTAIEALLRERGVIA